MQKLKELLNSEAALTAIAMVIASIVVREIGLDPQYADFISKGLFALFALAVAFGLGNNALRKRGTQELTFQGAVWTAKFLDLVEERYDLDIPAEIEEEVAETILGALRDNFVITQLLDKTTIEKKVI